MQLLEGYFLEDDVDSLPRTTAEFRMCSNYTFNLPYAFVTLLQLDLYLYILWVLPNVSDILPESHPLNQFSDNSTHKTNFTWTSTYTEQMHKISSDLVHLHVCKVGFKYDTVRYDIYLLHLGFHPVAVVLTIVQKANNSNIHKEKQYRYQRTHKIESKTLNNKK